MDVRELKESDISQCVKLGRRMHEESPYSSLEFDQSKCVAFACNAVGNDNAAWFVAEQDGEIIGIIGGCLTTPIFSSELTAQDILMYVTPEYRGLNVFRLLFATFYRWVLGKHAKVLLLSPHNTKFGAMLSRLGFENVGTIYRRFLA